MSSFDPWTQNITFYAADGETPIQLPIPQIDAFIKYLISVTVNYGTQLGAALAMLFVILIMTPSAKLRRPSGLLQVLVLVLCVIRMALLSSYFFSDFVEFYAFNTGDYSRVPAGHYGLSVAGNTFSLLLIIAVEACLMHQAWAMVALWPDLVRYLLASLSICVALLTIGWRLTALVHQNIAILSASSNHNNVWISKAAVITNALSICWFCALFNAKLVSHLVQNRGILPVGKSITPMEVLVMTNGVLMIIPGS
jgi:pheromone alpha factor receptor